MLDSALLAEGCGAMEVNALKGAVTFASGADAAKLLRAEVVVGLIAGAAICGAFICAPAAVDWRSTLEGGPAVAGASLAALVESFGPLAITLVPIPLGDVGPAAGRTGCALTEDDAAAAPDGASDSVTLDAISSRRGGAVTDFSMRFVSARAFGWTFT